MGSKCKKICDEKLPCGHKCDYVCHATDSRHIAHSCRQICEKVCSNGKHTCSGNHICGTECPPCQVEENPKLPCGHQPKLPCHKISPEMICTEPCNKIFRCDHRCEKLCWEECGFCNATVDKYYRGCGHEVKTACYLSWIPRKCTKLVLTAKQPKCGHPRYVPCHMAESVNRDENDPLTCNEICIEVPAGNGCGHNCPGDCDSCFQGRFHRRCDRPCNRKYLYCSHWCMSSCNKDCPPCAQKCEAFCDHGRCEKLCCIPCDPCKEPCTAKCEHSVCTKLCSEPCDRDPCSFPCSKKLQCGHMCIGYCGEICPPLCRECDREEIGRMFVLEEDLTPETRFIYIEGCQHTVDSETLTAWMKSLNTGVELEIASCPTCREPIYNLKRFSHIIAQNFREITDLKIRQIGNSDENAENIVELMLRLANMGQPESRFESTRLFLMDTLTESSYLYHKDEINCVQWIVGVLETAEKTMKEFTGKLNTVMFEHFGKLHSIFFDMIQSRSIPFGNPELAILNRELARLNVASDLLKRVSTPRNVHLLLYTQGHEDSREQFRVAYSLIVNKRYFGEDEEECAQLLIKNIDERLHFEVGIDETERQQIITAFGMHAGRWCKCPKGHIYIITECGGAMEVGKCNECGEQIGGEHHRLLNRNRVAPEMLDLKLPLLE